MSIKQFQAVSNWIKMCFLIFPNKIIRIQISKTKIFHISQYFVPIFNKV